MNLKTVSRKVRVKALKTARVYIPAGARLCPTHFNVISWEAVSDCAAIREFSPLQIDDMLDLALHKEEVNTGFLNKNHHSYTGLTDEQFDDLFSRTPSLWRTTSNESHAKNALLMLLMRFRKADSYEFIGLCFGIDRHKVSADIEIARNALTTDFVPLYLGFRNLSREFLLENTTASSRILHCGNNPETVITIWDGTYIYINKSSNYDFQKLTFSGQKNRNFLRPMVCVTTNGYIIDVFGPFEAVRNDAKCMKAILENDESVPESEKWIH